MQPLKETFEDDISIQRHIIQLQNEMKKRQPNASLVQDKMKRTAALRQRMCKQSTTAEVLNEFPSLKIPSVVSFILQHVFIVRTVFSIQDNNSISDTYNCNEKL
jgi:hypothetical protein